MRVQVRSSNPTGTVQGGEVLRGSWGGEGEIGDGVCVVGVIGESGDVLDGGG